MPSWLCLKTDAYLSEVPHYLVSLMTVCNHNLPLSVEGKTSQVTEIYIIMQQPNTRCCKSWLSIFLQSQSSNTIFSLKKELVYQLSTISELLECNRDYMQSLHHELAVKHSAYWTQMREIFNRQNPVWSVTRLTPAQVLILTLKCNCYIHSLLTFCPT